MRPNVTSQLTKQFCCEFTCKPRDAVRQSFTLIYIENRNVKWLGNRDILRRWLHEMDSANRKISNGVCKSMKCKYHPNVFPSCWGRLGDSIRIALVKPNSIPTGNLYPLLTVTDRISHTDYKSKYWKLVAESIGYLSHSWKNHRSTTSDFTAW